MSVTAAAFVVVGPGDVPIFQADFGPSGLRGQSMPAQTSITDDSRTLHELALHASLDIVDEMMWHTNHSSLRAVDRFNDATVFGYVTPSGTRFLLLVEAARPPSDDALKGFFADCHELYARAVSNPYQDRDAPIFTRGFEGRVRSVFRRHFG
eukprot:TRINITY_DN18205_c0_g1_i1.p1 TRINITY_DN18205_c0_g1~~TRINITY_DN18205_c0_g1_i1.p1  ORF type:complete len:152 (+),score=18.46 TRINITY_DN18205_c0_g1_i1:49-504(+)